MFLQASEQPKEQLRALEPSQRGIRAPRRPGSSDVGGLPGRDEFELEEMRVTRLSLVDVPGQGHWLLTSQKNAAL